MTSLHVHDDERFLLRCSPLLRDRAQQVPGARFNKAAGGWLLPRSLPVARVCRAVFPDLDVDPPVYEAVRQQAEHDEDVRKFKEGSHDFAPSFPGLFPYQSVAAECMYLQAGFVNQDDRGNGKTPTTLSALEHTKDFPAIVVCTTSMKGQWAEEAARWCPSATPIVAGRTPRQREDAILRAQGTPNALLIMSYAQIAKHSFLAPYGSIARTPAEKQPGLLNDTTWSTVIVDEAHKIKDPKAKQTRAIKALCTPETANRWALTATPIANHTADLWSILHFARPQDFPSRSKFIDRYVLTYQNPWGGTEDMGLNPTTEAEFRAIYDPVSIRRPLQIEAKMLPPEYRFVDMEPAQAKVYKTFEQNAMMRDDEGNFLVATNPMVLNARLQQFSAATPVLDDDNNVVALTTPSCKVDALFDLLDEMAGAPLVVFSESKKLLTLAYDELTKGRSPRLKPEEIGLITGDVPAEERTLTVQRFQAGHLPLIMCTIGAGSEGITLTRASTMCFLSRSYSMLSNTQAEGRLLRIGQDDDVRVINIITRDTAEARVYNATHGKEELLQALVKDPGWQRQFLPDPGKKDDQ